MIDKCVKIYVDTDEAVVLRSALTKLFVESSLGNTLSVQEHNTFSLFLSVLSDKIRWNSDSEKGSVSSDV